MVIERFKFDVVAVMLLLPSIAAWRAAPARAKMASSAASESL